MSEAKISLKKSDGKISLKKVSPALKNLELRFSWSSNIKLDADASALVCGYNADGKPVMLGPRYLVCYAIPADPERAVIAGEDVRDGTGDEETISIELDKVNPRAEEIPLILTIDGSPANGKHFGQVTGGKLILVNKDTNEALVEYDFADTKFVNNESLVHVASIFRDGDNWSVQGFAAGMKGADIYAAVDMFGGKSAEWYS